MMYYRWLELLKVIVLIIGFILFGLGILKLFQ
ncbi:hypothetical protein ACVWZB_004723 [Paenibacillus polymyxa]